MDGQNLFCDQPDCGDVAYVFGFAPNGSKSKVCRSHVLVLTDKRIAAFHIEAFEFMESADDGPLYERRRERVQQGLGNVSSLERICEEDYQRARRQIEETGKALQSIVERNLQELNLRVDQKYKETKQELQEWRRRLEQTVMNKSSELNADEKMLCDQIPAASLFRLALGDCSLKVTEILATHWHLLPVKGSRLNNVANDLSARLGAFAREQAAKGQADVAAEVAVYASMLGATDCPDFREEAAKLLGKVKDQLEMYFPSSLTPDRIHENSKAILQDAAQARKDANYKKALKALQRCETFHHLLSLESPELCFELGLVRSHFAQWSSADLILRRGYDLCPSGELALQLCSASTEQYYMTGRWQETVAMSEWVLQMWKSRGDESEMAKVLYYLVDSQCYLRRTKAEAWMTALAEAGPSCRYVVQLLQAEELRLEGRGDERLYEEVLGRQELRETYCTACGRFRLGLLYDEKQDVNKAEINYLSACEVFGKHYPHTLHYANCLNNLGIFYCAAQRLDKSLEYQSKACQIYTQYFPYTLECADSYHNLGFVYYLLKQQIEAEEYYVKAIALYAQYFQDSLNYPSAMHNLALLYETSKPQAAVEQYRCAVQCYSDRFPQSAELANCLNNLGFLYERAGDKVEALDKLKEARVIYSTKGVKEGEERCIAALNRISSKT